MFLTYKTLLHWDKKKDMEYSVIRSNKENSLPDFLGFWSCFQGLLFLGIISVFSVRARLQFPPSGTCCVICLGAAFLKQCFSEPLVVCLRYVFSLFLLCTFLYWKKVHDRTTKDKKMVFIAFHAHFSFDLTAEQIAQSKAVWMDSRDQCHISPVQSLSHFVQILLPSFRTESQRSEARRVQRGAPWLALPYLVQSPTSFVCLRVSHLEIILCKTAKEVWLCEIIR